MHQESSPGKMGDMTRLLLLLLLVGVAVSSPVDLQKRIIGGQDCGDERHYHVKFVIGNNVLQCGGSLISEKWILTAAHCWDNGMIPVLGLHPDPTQVQRGRIVRHQIYKKVLRKHDIMLVELADPTTIQPVRLPDCNNVPPTGTLVQVAGYAATVLGPNNRRVPGESPTLQCVELEIIDNSPSTPERIKTFFQKYGTTHIKLYQAKDKDTSGGDSGGGVVHNGMIYGVHVFTYCETHGCVAPAGFVDVCKYKKWIEKTASVRFQP